MFYTSFYQSRAIESMIVELKLDRHQGEYNAYLGFSAIDAHHLQTHKEEFLHPLELQQYLTIIHENKKKSFLQGRILAKIVLACYLGESDLKTIRIKSGVFEQPLVVYKIADTPMISISHTAAYTACLAFSDEHPMAIDLETITLDAKKHISSQATYLERNLQYTLQEEENSFYTRLWTIKEALSKVMKTGLMAPLEIYQVDTIKQLPLKGFTVSTFTHFPQYKAFSFPWKNTICSIVLPKETNISQILTDSF